jgi:hypothetical protein
MGGFFVGKSIEWNCRSVGYAPTSAKNSLDEGHGFSRAVKSHNTLLQACACTELL